MTISASSLFHFTESLENLVSILTHEFRPRLSFEDAGFMFEGVPPGDDAFAWTVPVSSFCDIPLSQALQHMGTYGNFGIGLTKEWGIRSGVAPVLYSHPRSPVSKSIEGLFLLRDDAAKGSVSPKVRLLVRMLHHVKPYVGDFHRRASLVPNVVFYDEREWRWVPQEAGNWPSLTRDEYADPIKREQGNVAVWDLDRLAFEPSDIRYLIVATEAEILPLVRAVAQIKGKYSHDQVQVLCTRVISAEQIRADF